MHKNKKMERFIHFVAFINLEKPQDCEKQLNFAFYSISVFGLLANTDSESLFPEEIPQSLIFKKMRHGDFIA